MKKVQLDTRPVRPPGSLAATAKATRQAKNPPAADIQSHVDDPNLLKELEAHDKRMETERIARTRYRREKKIVEEHQKEEATKARKARARYDKAMRIARKRNIKKAIRRGKSTIVHSQESKAFAEKLKAKAERAEADADSRDGPTEGRLNPKN